MCVFAQKCPQWFKAVCSFLCFFPPFLHMCNHWWWNPRPDATASNTRSLTHSLTDSHTHTLTLATYTYPHPTYSLHLTTFCLQYKPTVIACVCIHLACKWSNWEIPVSTDGKHWWEYVDNSVTLELLDGNAGHQSLYVAASNSGCDLFLIFFFFLCNTGRVFFFFRVDPWISADSREDTQSAKEDTELEGKTILLCCHTLLEE